jgi:hypothetical protein
MKKDRIKNDRIKSDRIKNDRIKADRIQRITDPLTRHLYSMLEVFDSAVAVTAAN